MNEDVRGYPGSLILDRLGHVNPDMIIAQSNKGKHSTFVLLAETSTLRSIHLDVIRNVDGTVRLHMGQGTYIFGG